MTIHEISDPVVARNPDADGSVERSIEGGRTLPSSWYTSPEVFALEQRYIFRRAWDCVGHRGLVARPGDYFTCVSGGVPIVVVCGRDSVVRAFLNICRHRQNAVAIGHGNSRLLRCGYHSWTYKLDGSFNAAPRSKEDPNFDGSGLCLAPVGVDILGDMVFVNASNDAPPLLEVLGPIPEQARAKGIPLETASFRETRSLEVDANWKVSWDNNCECYHCSTVHASWYQEADLTPDKIYSFPVGTFHFQHVMNSREDSPVDNHFFCWPTFTLATDSSSGPGYEDRAAELRTSNDDMSHHGYFSWRWVPLSPGRTRIEFHLFTVDLTDPAALDAWFTALFVVMAEDKVICESVQRSHSAGVGEPGTLIPAIDSEFQTQVWERLVHRAITQPDVPLYAPLLERSDTWPTSGGS